ncbi:MAG TPA: histidine kinase dimerization/phosphoacceptor domain -containing protein [Vicinamibacteria bacterium]
MAVQTPAQPIARDGGPQAARRSSLASTSDYRDLFENAPDAYIYADGRATIRRANRAAAVLLNVPDAFLVGKPLTFFVVPEGRAAVVRELGRWKAADHAGELLAPIKPWRGTPFPGAITVSAVRDRHARLLGLRCLLRDVRERQRADERLQASLREKEVLLREVHHRVKNNLQLICSLLSLQSSRTPDPRVGALLSATRARVASMALVHEDLCRSEDLSRIDFAEYVRRLAGHLMSSHGTDERRILVRVETRGVRLGIDIAIPAGMIVSELLANALEHAFAGREGGEVAIEVSRSAHDECTIVVRDDGRGLPRRHPAPTLGLQLVNMLTEQLRGRIDVHTAAGTEFVIRFPAPGLITARP